MPELAAADVQTYTKGRLLASDTEVQRLLAAALRLARNYCGWHVTPVREDVLELDGPGGHVLALPTRLIVDVAITEDGTVLDIADLRVSKTMGTVKKRSGARWSGDYGAIAVTMTHGHEAAEDFDQAVLAAVDAVSLSVGLSSDARGSGLALTKKRVDDVEYWWSDRDVAEALNTTWLDSYRRVVFT